MNKSIETHGMTPTEQAAADRRELKITQADNGFTVRAHPKFLVFANLNDVIEYVRKHFSKDSV